MASGTLALQSRSHALRSCAVSIYLVVFALAVFEYSELPSLL